MKLNKITLQKKIIFILIIFTFILWIATTVVVKEFVSFNFKKELDERGISIGRNLSENCIEPILVDDIIKLQKLISNTKNLEKDIIYIFILDKYKKPIVHTFGDYFPDGLENFNQLPQNKENNIVILNTEKGMVSDIILPILKGNLGYIRIGVSLERVNAKVASIINKLIKIIFIILFFGILLVYLFTIKTLSPLKKLTFAMKKVGEGELNQKILITSSDEIGILAKAFNEMTEKLNAANLELKNAQAKLIQSAKMATIGQFSTGVAHEINNPLSGILNCIRTLLSNPEIKGETRGYLELSLKGLLRIENTIKKILDFSYPHQLKNEEVNLNKVLESSLEFFKHRIKEQKILLNLNLTKSLPIIFGDVELLHQVFTNIISNALDSMATGGVLDIKTYLKDENINIEIKDSGCGIKQENLDRVFEPFWTTKEVGKGVGLGLFICYNIIKQHNGTIGIESKEAEGTKVIVNLPVDRANYE